MTPLLRRPAPRLILAVVTGVLLLGACTQLLQLFARQKWQSPIHGSRNVLVVIAHPDDETIFFSPTILALRQQQRQVHLLCFTTGNFHGLGDIRVQELRKAAAALQVDEQHLVIVNDSGIQDGKQEVWPVNKLAEIIAEEAITRNIDTVVTFDHEGVYGHANHAACEEGVRRYAANCIKDAESGGLPCPSTWMLHTEKARKAMGILSAVRVAASCSDHHAACYVTPSLVSTLWAMAQHATQGRWWGHVLTRSYTFVNSLDPISEAQSLLPDADKPVHTAREIRQLKAQSLRWQAQQLSQGAGEHLQSLGLDHRRR